MSTHFLVAFAGSIAFYNSTQSDRDDVHFADVPWRFCCGGAATSPARSPATTELRSGSLPSNEGPWRLVVGSGSVSDNCWSPGAFQKHPMGVVSPSLNLTRLTQLIPALLAGERSKDLPPFHWNGLEPCSHQGLVVIERTSLLHVTLPVVCKIGSIHRMLVGLVLAFRLKHVH